MRTILNINKAPQGYGAVPAEGVRLSPAPGLFRMGETPSEGAWTRWGSALLVAALVHVGALAVGLSAPRVSARTAPRPPAPELVVLSFAPPPPAPAGAAAAVAPVPQRVQRQARTLVQRPALVQPTPKPVEPQQTEPLVEPKPEVTPEAPVEPAVAETPAAVEETSAVGPGTGAGGEGAVIGGVAGGVAGGREGGLVGATGGVALELKQVARAPSVLQQVTPSYPRRARSQGIEGFVLLRIIIGTDGHVEPEHTRVLRSVPELDAAAIAAVGQWRFSPAIGRQGQPVRVMVDVPVQFSLK
jgi:protein TonB